MNFDMAAELLESFGVQSKTVRVMDDVASAPKGGLPTAGASREIFM